MNLTQAQVDAEFVAMVAYLMDVQAAADILLALADVAA